MRSGKWQQHNTGGPYSKQRTREDGIVLLSKQLFTPMISEVANRNFAWRNSRQFSQDHRVKRVAAKGSAGLGNMIILLCRICLPPQTPPIRAVNFPSCARVPLQDNETIHKLSSVRYLPRLTMSCPVLPCLALPIFFRPLPTFLLSSLLFKETSQVLRRFCSCYRKSTNWQITWMLHLYFNFLALGTVFSRTLSVVYSILH